MRVELVSVRVRPTRRRNLRIVEARCATTRAPRPRSGSTRASSRVRSSRGSCCSCAPTVRAGARARAGRARARGAGRDGRGPAHERRGGRLRRLAHALHARAARARRAAPAAYRRDRRSAARSACASARRLPLRRDAHRGPARAAHARGRPRSRATGWRTRSCCCCRSRCAERRARRGPAAPTSLGRPGELLRRYHAVAPVHAHDGPEAQRARRRPRPRARSRPMRRLLLGDVGSGKTVVAVHAMLRAAERGGQARCWRPPRCWCSSTPRPCAACVEPLGSRARRRDRETCRRPSGVRACSASPRATRSLVVGTHALLECERRVRPPARDRRRRAAPLRRRAARRALRGPRRARPAHDRDADPALAGALALRRPRPHRAARAACRAAGR